MQIIKAPQPIPSGDEPCVFLAGSIEMGTAPRWREEVARQLADCDVTLLDPWRDDWDNSWRQNKDDPQFRQQVEWELDAQERADAIFMYFAPGTTAPISLLEFGLFARSRRMVVCCPPGFWRKGNVDLVCERFHVPCFDAMGEAVEHLLFYLGYAP